MEAITFGFIINCINAIGTFLIGISAIFGLYKYFRNQSVTNETLYGEEADERLKDFKFILNKCSSFQLAKTP